MRMCNQIYGSDDPKYHHPPTMYTYKYRMRQQNWKKDKSSGKVISGRREMKMEKGA